jgi:AraC family transcriptional regulator, melibiose operon regulatory protein
MIRYIHLHADRKLTLLDIARAGKLSRSSCESAFGRVLHTSPIQYLLNFRLEKGLELLLSTSLTVTEIAQQCGFCSGSYFAEQLRKRSGVAPGEYRKKRRPLPAPSGVKP